MARITLVLALLVLAVPALRSPPAQAQSITLHQSELWKTTSTRTPQGQSLCALGTAFEYGRKFYIKWFEGTDNLVVQIFKDGWAIPADVSAPVVFHLDRSEPWSVRTVRLGRPADYLEFPIAHDVVRLFTHDFTASRTMRIEFPGGAEQPWDMNLQGNGVAIDALVRCIMDTAGPGNPTQPYVYLLGPSYPQRPGTTQPFGAQR